jgi:hypothetical protein
MDQIWFDSVTEKSKDSYKEFLVDARFSINFGAKVFLEEIMWDPLLKNLTTITGKILRIQILQNSYQNHLNQRGSNRNVIED